MIYYRKNSLADFFAPEYLQPDILVQLFGIWPSNFSRNFGLPILSVSYHSITKTVSDVIPLIFYFIYLIKNESFKKFGDQVNGTEMGRPVHQNGTPKLT